MRRGDDDDGKPLFLQQDLAEAYRLRKLVRAIWRRSLRQYPRGTAAARRYCAKFWHYCPPYAVTRCETSSGFITAAASCSSTRTTSKIPLAITVVGLYHETLHRRGRRRAVGDDPPRGVFFGRGRARAGSRPPWRCAMVDEVSYHAPSEHFGPELFCFSHPPRAMDLTAATTMTTMGTWHHRHYCRNGALPPTVPFSRYHQVIFDGRTVWTTPKIHFDVASTARVAYCRSHRVDDASFLDLYRTGRR
jgi:hypothetical protein